MSQHRPAARSSAPVLPAAANGVHGRLQTLQRTLGNQRLQQVMRSLSRSAREAEPPVVTSRHWARDSGQLWYLNGERNEANQPTQIDLRSNFAGNAHYTWEILEGADRVELGGTHAPGATVSRATDSRMQLRGLAGSHGQDDVVVQVTRSDAGGTPLSVERGTLGVRSPAGTRPAGITRVAPAASPGPTPPELGGSGGAVPEAEEDARGDLPGGAPPGVPRQLAARGATHHADATWAYMSYISYEVLDDRGNPITGFDVNEQFPGSPTSDHVGCDWRQSAAGGFHATGTTFADHIGGESSGHTPAPTAPQTPLGSTKTQHWSQEWFIGSLTPGHGTKVQTNTFQKFADHGEHTNIRSPP